MSPLDALDRLSAVMDALANYDDSATITAACADLVHVHAALDDLVHDRIVILNPRLRADVVSAVRYAQQENAAWYGNRALVEDEGSIVDLTRIVTGDTTRHLFAHQHTAGYGDIYATAAGRRLLVQWEHDVRHPWRAIARDLLGRRKQQPDGYTAFEASLRRSYAAHRADLTDEQRIALQHLMVWGRVPVDEFTVNGPKLVAAGYAEVDGDHYVITQAGAQADTRPRQQV